MSAGSIYRGGFLAGATNALYDHGIPEPIIACHRLKIVIALEDELRAAPDAAWGETACTAVNWYRGAKFVRFIL